MLPPHFRPVLINADLTDDHLLLLYRFGTWRISALIDWADAEVGSPEYEWVAYWFILCRQNAAMFRETLRVYDPAEIIAHVLGRSGAQAGHTLHELLERLWPPF